MLAADALQGRHAVWLYSVQSKLGTPVTPATPLGLGTGSIDSQSGQRPLYGLGNWRPLFIKPGGSQVAFDGQVAVCSSGFLIECCSRDANGSLPYFTLALGYKDDADSPTRWAMQVQDCKIAQMELSLDSGDGSNLLMLSFSGVGGLITEVTSLDPVDVTAMPFGEFECILTKGGEPHPAKSFRLAVANNVRQRRGIPGSAPTRFERGFIDQPEGQEEVTGEVVRYVRSGLDMQAASMSGSDLVLSCADLATRTNTLVITATDAQYGAERITPSMEDDILYTTPFNATGVTFA